MAIEIIRDYLPNVALEVRRPKYLSGCIWTGWCDARPAERGDICKVYAFERIGTNLLVVSNEVWEAFACRIKELNDKLSNSYKNCEVSEGYFSFLDKCLNYLVDVFSVIKGKQICVSLHPDVDLMGESYLPHQSWLFDFSFLPDWLETLAPLCTDGRGNDLMSKGLPLWEQHVSLDRLGELWDTAPADALRVFVNELAWMMCNTGWEGTLMQYLGWLLDILAPLTFLDTVTKISLL